MKPITSLTKTSQINPRSTKPDAPRELRAEVDWQDAELHVKQSSGKFYRDQLCSGKFYRVNHGFVVSGKVLNNRDFLE